MIPTGLHSLEDEKCSSPAFVSCRWSQGRQEVRAGARSCPFLQEMAVRFCSGAPVAKFLPHCESLSSCCENDGHTYCDLYLSHLNDDEAFGGSAPRVNGIDIPLHLAFAPNHLWLDVREGGSCHIGVDAFLAKSIGSVEKVYFVASPANCRPSVVLRVCGLDLTLICPARLEVSGSNVHLRRDPDPIVRDPYVRGWLFQGRIASHPSPGRGLETVEELYRGKDALAWMKRETERLRSFVGEQVSRSGGKSERSPSDEDWFRVPPVPYLETEQNLRLFKEFFSLDRYA